MRKNYTNVYLSIWETKTEMKLYEDTKAKYIVSN